MDSKTLLLAAKLIALLSIAYLAFLFLPLQAHHLLLVISITLILIGGGSFLKYKQHNNWIEDKAKIVDIGEASEIVAIGQYSKLKYFYPVIDYEYAVDGKNYSGNTVSNEKENVWVAEVNGWGDPNPETARWWLSLKPEDDIPVFINPKNHSDTVLVKGASKVRRSHHLALLLGGLLLGLIWLTLVGMIAP
ncbi:MAG: DUF3592 domain-containing protein [Candidatus Thiodiazotropha endolucinida]